MCIRDREYTVAGEAEYSAIRYIIDSTMSIFEREILVFPDDEQICALMAEGTYEGYSFRQILLALFEELQMCIRDRCSTFHGKSQWKHQDIVKHDVEQTAE